MAAAAFLRMPRLGQELRDFTCCGACFASYRGREFDESEGGSWSGTFAQAVGCPSSIGGEREPGSASARIHATECAHVLDESATRAGACVAQLAEGGAIAPSDQDA